MRMASTDTVAVARDWREPAAASITGPEDRVMPNAWEPNRRALVAGVATAGLTSVAGASLAAPGPLPRAGGSGLNLTDPDDYLKAVLKMRGSLDEKLVIGFTIGRYYGVVDNTPTYLFDLLAAAFFLYRPRADGGYEDRTFEIAYFTDAATGRPLETFLNPYTNKRVKVPQTRLGPTDRTLTRQARIISRGTPPGGVFDDQFLPARVVGDDVWITEQYNVYLPAGMLGPTAFRFNELTTAHASKADLDNPALTRVPTTTSTQIQVDWRPWLEMTDLRGHMNLTSAGRMLSRVEDLPDTYLELGHRYHPDVLRDPYAFMTRGWKPQA